MGHILRVFIFARLTLLGCLAISTNDERNHLEILPTAASRIVRHEQIHTEPASLIQSQVQSANTPMELEPDIMGDHQSTTEIVQSGAGPTTTAIYAVGQGPMGGPAPNAIDLTPAPPNYYEPGPPGIPGPPGPPGPPGDPGPPEGYAPYNASNSTGPLLTSSAGAHGGNNSGKVLGIHTQSGYEIRGPPGVGGAKGPPGAQGDIGSIGLEGVMGDRGPPGYPGPKGERGPAGKRQHVNAPPKQWLYYAFAVNGAFALLVLIISYLEFVAKKHPYRYCFGGECCSEKCGNSGDSFNGCCYAITCGCCCRPKNRGKAAAEGENWEYGENYGGYENQ